MNENILYNNNAKFINSIKFKIPNNSSIIDIKIKNMNFFSKIINKGKVAIYGNYEILAIYKLFLSSYKFKIKTINKKINFYKIFIVSDISEYISETNIKSEIKSLEQPKCYYFISKNSHRNISIKTNNTCKIYIFSLLSITFFPKNSLEKELVPYEEKKSNTNLTTKEKTKKKRFIYATSIVGNGLTNFLLEKEILVEKNTPPIWLVDHIDVDVHIPDLILLGEQIIASGFASINISYKTFSSSLDNVITGKLSYINVNIPISTPVQLTMNDDIKPKKSDIIKILKAQCLSVNYKLSGKFNTPSGEILYNKIFAQISIQIKILATRTEKIFISALSPTEGRNYK